MSKTYLVQRHYIALHGVNAWDLHSLGFETNGGLMINKFPIIKKIKNGSLKGKQIILEGYYRDLTGKSWMESDGNPACLIFAIRSANDNIPTDDDVLYGKINNLGHIIHISEIELE